MNHCEYYLHRGINDEICYADDIDFLCPKMEHEYEIDEECKTINDCI